MTHHKPLTGSFADPLPAAVVQARETLAAYAATLGSVGTYDAAKAQLVSALAGSRVENLCVLFLNRKNELLAAEIMAEGTIDHVPVYPREIVRRALILDASAIVIGHNHPSGDPSPSKADIEMTLQVKAACDALGVTLHDHIIIGGTRDYSLRASGDF